MAIKVYVSGISGNHEIRKQQQRVLFILSSLKIDFEVIDITEIGKENDREFMRTQCKLHDKSNALPPQIFNEDVYCGDFEDFEAANEDDRLKQFLKLTSETPQLEDIANQMLSNVETGESEALKV
ncbi:SH3 domain-binding glutamic acid-rich protein homolog [Parasteatoda tepidariorum]|uniref:SH3 domain-binding glutamic acid-rich protein homolog n=1 Tax=Parasteatoda tepidariorum TaxID=114398 RepID=UPI00077FC7DF|nr:SH3 domain-binding glutamic acid-rich protein homolog [Parasteatoda tepidariorum]